MASRHGAARPPRREIMIGAIAVTMLSLLGATAVATRADARPTGYLSICTQESGKGLEGIVFNYSAGGKVYSAPVGACSAAYAVRPGHMTVTQLARSGARLVDVSTTPTGRIAKQDLAKRSVVVDVPAGDAAHQTIVTFTDAIRPGTGFLKICKIAGAHLAVGTKFAFTVGRRTANVTAGPASSGGYCVLVDSFPDGRLSVTEHPAAGTTVQSISVSPAPRLRSKDISDRTVTVTIDSGTTTVTYTNARRG